MRYSRTSEEALTDKAVLLALLTRISHKNNTSLGDRLKLQKITFLFCYQLFIQRIKALNYTFFTYRWGPFTKDLYEAEADFEQAELIQRRGPSYSVTETGQAWGNSLYRAIESDPGNRGIVQAMDSVADGYAKEATGPLVELTHDMSVMPIGWQEKKRLGDLPFNLDLTGPLDDEEAVALIEVERGLLDSFAMMLGRSSSLKGAPTP